jgi:hypothetical protein
MPEIWTNLGNDAEGCGKVRGWDLCGWRVIDRKDLERQSLEVVRIHVVKDWGSVLEMVGSRYMGHVTVHDGPSQVTHAGVKMEQWQTEEKQEKRLD